ncbi:hypothetical protein [Gordonia aichiensis]|uniref:Uncharacterized protein n=1 Tax=Gordonia aichiensis NBRC 108223 TaxID=1220583 RepID=L7KM00_9ACTN|nr:hypothetical protein [Gordonia aichiensis]GAC49511.1 hypothetical protein GOACH_15_00030 [Gordonia aichiensis NBRC 108223]
MTTTTDTTLLETLHALAVKGLASDSVLSAMTGLDEEALSAVVTTALDDGLVLRREGRVSGTLITPKGRERLAELRAAHPLSASEREAMDAAYEAFLPINGEFKRVCAAWQMKDDTTPNDHSDTTYDAAVISDLDRVHDQIVGVLTTAASDVARLARYDDRLARALERVHGGDTAAFARPMYDSYHDIWMELHQDLLTTTGRERGADDEG